MVSSKTIVTSSSHSHVPDPPPPTPLAEQPLTESAQCHQTKTTPNEPDDIASHENTHENTPDSETTAPSNQNTHTGPAQEYLVKTISWIDFNTREAKDVRIITQNGNMNLVQCYAKKLKWKALENGPCPLVAICKCVSFGSEPCSMLSRHLGNVLFLRGDLEIRPPDRQVVTFEYLVERLGDYLLNHGPSTTSTTTATTTTTNHQNKVKENSCKASCCMILIKHHNNSHPPHQQAQMMMTIPT